jgi:hypothetical protein
MACLREKSKTSADLNANLKSGMPQILIEHQPEIKVNRSKTIWEKI